MAYERPDAAAFKALCARDFPFGEDDDTDVLDADINRALLDTECSFNEGLWSTQASFTQAYLYLTAHNLVMNLRASQQGMNGQFSWLQTAKAAGNVSEGFAVPQQVLDHPILGLLSKTNYGARYLQLVLPKITGQVFTACGATKP